VTYNQRIREFARQFVTCCHGVAKTDRGG
jgi:hypothetical protein